MPVVQFPRSVIVGNTTHLEVAETHMARGKALVSSGKHSAAAHWYRLAADLGHPEAQFALACMYYNGEGVSQDLAAAARLLQNAANSGIVEADLILGNMYEHGSGVHADAFAAERLYRRAASKGDTGAALLLGRLLERMRDTSSSSSDECAEEDADACEDECADDCEEEREEEYETGSFYVAPTQCDYAMQIQCAIDEAKRKSRFDLYGI